MTDNDIMKALEMCIPIEHNCSLCPLSEEIYCCNHLLHEVFDLYNRQKAEVERLTVDCEKYKAERDEFANLLGRIREMAQSEAIKEFIELMKENSVDIFLYGEVIPICRAERLAKELTEQSVNYESSKLTE